ncbi:MAG: protein-L-isoaspartate(D-aspartate) O-methyltransferase [Deferrisomatales bacterium]|nr:protein-L-isoaspartate(D-aspartate) O-methyltransferase [Deferrisomatales bacterium]
MRGLAVVLFLAFLPQWAAAEGFALQRDAMVETIRRDVEDTRRYLGKGELDLGVLAALGRVRRHEFVPRELRDRAYQNRPLPIGYGQTISQPYIVALMTDLLRVGPGDRVLELGTGSGYQAAVLAELGCRVFTVEIVPALHEAATGRLARLGYDQVRTRQGDGYHGWAEHGPFDAIVVTAAASHVPPPLVEQLKPGGRMVIPLGNPFLTQQLSVVEKDAAGAVRTRQFLPVVFVPLTGGHGAGR